MKKKNATLGKLKDHTLPVRRGHGTLALVLVSLSSLGIGLITGAVVGYLLEAGESATPLRHWLEKDIAEGPDAG